MTELKWICISFQLTLLLNLAVGGTLNINQKWSAGNHFGYEGGFCLPGLCIEGSAGSRVHNGRNQYGGGTPYRETPYRGTPYRETPYRGTPYRETPYRGSTGYRETMYCRPMTCYGGSCEALHLHIDKGLYESLISKKNAPSTTVDYNIQETLKHNVNKNYDFKEVKEAAMAPQSN